MSALFASVAHAQSSAYAEAFDTLYRVDLPTHTATEIGQAGSYAGQIIGNISGLSYDPEGHLYAAAGGMNALIKIDPDTGRATVVGSFGLTGQGDPQRNDALDLSMTFACDGTLWLASAYANKIWTVDPATGATTLVGTTNHVITGLIARGHGLFGAGGRGDNTFYRIDPTSGATTAVGSYGRAPTTWINSISMSTGRDGTLWALLNYVPPAPGSDVAPEWSDLATIDPASGNMTIVGPVTGPASLEQVGMKGIAVAPPSCIAASPAVFAAPATSPPWLALLGIALGLLAAGALRRRVSS